MHLNALPAEILLEIIDLLDYGPPSVHADFHQPHLASLHRPLEQQHLKRLSLVSRRWHQLVFPTLFTHLHVSVQKLFSRPGRMGPWKRHRAAVEFPHFVRTCLDSNGSIHSLVVHTAKSYDELYNTSPDDFRGLNHKLWNLIQDFVNPQRLVILAPPPIVAALMTCSVWMGDQWSFNMPYQRVELLQNDAERAGSRKDRDTWVADAVVDTDGVLPLLFPWHTLKYDEGSSLNNYGSYHYFEKKPPCLMLRSATQLIRMGHWLRNFHYTAIFPHYDSFFDVISTIGKFYALRHLVVQLAPAPDSEVLSDTSVVSRGNTSMRDCWSEVERCYSLVISALTNVHGWEQPSCWAFSLKALKTFESRDCSTPAVREDILRLFEVNAPGWRETKPAIWKNPQPRQKPERSRVA